MVGYGTYLMPNDETTTVAVKQAIKAGYRSIDTARVYANEEAVGKGIREAIAEGIIKREEIFVTTKLWLQDFAPEDVEPACRASLERLGLEYVDLYLMHNCFRIKKTPDTTWPTDADGRLIVVENNPFETYKAMQKLVEQGLVKHIGVSNWKIELLEELRLTEGVTIMPYANQIEVHLYQQQEPMRDFCMKHGIRVMAYAPLGRGREEHFVVIDDPVLNEVAKEINKPVACTELRFVLQLSPNMTLLVKSKQEDRIKQNLSLDFTLSEDQVNRLKKRNRAEGHHLRSFKQNIDPIGNVWSW